VQLEYKPYQVPEGWKGSDQLAEILDELKEVLQAKTGREIIHECDDVIGALTTLKYMQARRIACGNEGKDAETIIAELHAEYTAKMESRGWSRRSERNEGVTV